MAGIPTVIDRLARGSRQALRTAIEPALRSLGLQFAGGASPLAEGTADGLKTQALGSYSSGSASGTSYHAAAIDAQTRNWIPQIRSGDSALLDSWYMLTARVEDLMRNEPSLGAARRNLTKHIIRTGIQTYADVVIDDEPADDFNTENDRWFEHWSEHEADVEGKHAFPELQWHAHDNAITYGDGILLKCFDNSPGRSVPLCYQLLEAAQIDETMTYPAGLNGPDGIGAGNRVIRGVELDKKNRAVAYWIFDAHPYDQYTGWTSKSTRIPADRVIHYFVPFQSSMTRGVTWFAPLVRPARDTDTYIGSELTSAVLGALMVFVHKTNLVNNAATAMGLQDGLPTSDQYGNPLIKIGPGTKTTIAREDEFEVLENKRPGNQVAPFTKFLRQEQAMGYGASYVTHTGDFSQTSFTSAHGAANEENAYFQPLQQRFGRRLVSPIRREHTRVAAAYGLYSTLPAAQFAKQPLRWSALTVQPPGRDQLDPLKQTEGSAARVRMGLSTLKDECGKEGKNWRAVLRQRAVENRYAEKLDVTLDFSKGASTPADEAADVVEAAPEGA